MNDLTSYVLILGLALTLVLFSASSLSRWRTTRKSVTLPPPFSGLEDAELLVPTSRAIKQPPALPQGRVPVWFYRPWDLIGVAFILYIFCGAVLIPQKSQGAAVQSINVDVMIINIGFQFVMAAIIFCLVFWRVHISTWLGLRWKNWHWILLIAPSSLFAMWALLGALYFSGYTAWMDSLGVETVQDTVKLLKECNDPLIVGLMAFAAVIAAPLCEEVVFRGYLYPVMKRFAGPWSAGFCSAFIFAAAHSNLAALLPLFILGGLLVIIYEKTGSIWAPIGVHFAFNGATVVIQMAARYFDIPVDPNL